MEDKTTRRKFIKSAAWGAGLLISGRPIVFANVENDKDYISDFCAQRRPLNIAADNPAILFHDNLCSRCGRCPDFCQNEMTVSTPDEDICIYCGQCTIICRRLALTEKYHYRSFAQAVADPEKITVASIAPAIRVALGEMYGLAPGTDVEGKIVGALKQLGVDHTLDVTFAADLTVMEEAAELIQRLEENGTKNPLPMFTSCCPAWVRFVELFYSPLLHNLSTAKSPVMMQGALVKTYFAQKQDIDPEKIVHVALVPCTAKKWEILLDGMNAAGISQGKPEMRDVDFALTCRELSNLINEGDVNFLQATDTSCVSMMGAGSGAGMIFGATGGVMEATLRTAYKLLNAENPPDDFFELRPLRGFDNVRRASVDLGKYRLTVAVVHGVSNARTIIEEMKNGVQKYDFVEVMACSGGCIGGGGQPINRQMNTTELKQMRMNAMFQRDVSQKIRLSCDNPEIMTIYDEFLGKPLGKMSEELLHIKYR